MRCRVVFLCKTRRVYVWHIYFRKVFITFQTHKLQIAHRVLLKQQLARVHSTTTSVWKKMRHNTFLHSIIVTPTLLQHTHTYVNTHSSHTPKVVVVHEFNIYTFKFAVKFRLHDITLDVVSRCCSCCCSRRFANCFILTNKWKRK